MSEGRKRLATLLVVLGAAAAGAAVWQPVLGIAAVLLIAAAEMIRRDLERRADAVAAQLRQRLGDAEDQLSRQQRRLTDSQKRAIRDAAAGAGPRELMIRPRAGDPESIRFAGQLAACFREGTWAVDLQEGIADQILYGMYLRHRGPAETPEAVEVAQRVLAAGQLDVPVRQTRDAGLPPGAAVLMIGYRDDS